MKTLRAGWYLGEKTFADQLRSLFEREKGQLVGRDSVGRSHNEAEAENLVKRTAPLLGMPIDQEGLSVLRKGDLRKVLQ
ncbi:hypothetical protein ACFSSA_11355 [Luteolibacter algae]|uniref:Uncharacterized protein n=1 Tax=Luteolibacter algae TaxID=454151 RepID=A0ABW5D899_9BACT